MLRSKKERKEAKMRSIIDCLRTISDDTLEFLVREALNEASNRPSIRTGFRRHLQHQIEEMDIEDRHRSS